MNIEPSKMSNVSPIVHCDRHGDMQEAFVCEHLLSGERLGFVHDMEDPGNPRPDAWCASCERLRIAHGGWNERSHALVTIKLVCGGCYDEIKARNVTS